jgi:putative transposase
MSRPERLALVDHGDQAVPVVAQCQRLKVARSTLYYHPAPVSMDDLAVMRRIDELYLASPFYGSRRMTAVLRRESWPVNRQRVRVPDRGDGLVQSAGPGMAGVDHVGSGFPRRGVAGRDAPVRPAGDFQDDRGMMHLRLSY